MRPAAVVERVAACLAVEEGGAPVGVADPRQDGVLGLLQELHAHGFEEIAVILAL